MQGNSATQANVCGRQIAFEVNMFMGDSNEVSFSKSVGSYALTDWVVYLSQAAAAQSSADFVIDTAVGTKLLLVRGTRRGD